jgi:hypothetical protein
VAARLGGRELRGTAYDFSIPNTLDSSCELQPRTAHGTTLLWLSCDE